MNRFRSTRWAALALVVIAAAAAMIVWLAPAERTMGDGIRPVYVHVALIWTGMFGMLAAGLLGLALALSSRTDVGEWMDAVGWVTLGFLAAALIASFAAQTVNWNGIFLDEPRMQMSIRVLAVFLIVQIANRWLPWSRVRGLVMAASSAIMLAAMRFSPLVLHPKDPISTASSASVQLTFALLFVLCLSGAGVVVWYVSRWRGFALRESQADTE